MNRTELEDKIDDYQSTSPNMPENRSRIDGGVFRTIKGLEFISSRYFPYTAAQVAVELEVHQSQALRWLRTAELYGWVKLVEGGKGTGHAHRYKTRVRMRRIA